MIPIDRIEDCDTTPNICAARRERMHERYGRRESHLGLAGVAFVIALVCVLPFCGCAQNTEAPFKETITQTTPTPVSADQEAATQGSQVYVYIVNAPGKSTLPDGQTLNLTAGEAGSDIASLNNIANDANGANSGTTKAGFLQSGFAVNITTGGTAPSLSSAPNVGPTVSSVANPNTQTSPQLRAKGEVDAAIPISIAPGGISDVNAVATGRGTSDVTKTSDIDQKIANLKGEVDKLQDMLGKFLNGPPKEETPVEVPTTQSAQP